MANPLFAPTPPPPAKDWRWFEPTAKAFSLVVEAGWSIDGALRVFERGLKYAVFTMTGPDGSVVFWGDDRLPFRAVVPGPWNGPLVPPMPYQMPPPLKMMPWHSPQAVAPQPFPARHMDPLNNSDMRLVFREDGTTERKRIPPEADTVKRIWFGEGDAAHQLYLGHYVPAEHLYHPVMFHRFGASFAEKVEQDIPQLERIRTSSAEAGIRHRRLDACTVDFMALDRTRKGRVHLSTYGGDQPGETWECNFIHGFFSTTDAFKATEAVHSKALDSFSTEAKWMHGNNDIAAAHATTRKTQTDTGKWQVAETEALIKEREMIDGIVKGTVDNIKSRKHGGG